MCVEWRDFPSVRSTCLLMEKMKPMCHTLPKSSRPYILELGGKDLGHARQTVSGLTSILNWLRHSYKKAVLMCAFSSKRNGMTFVHGYSL